MTNRRRFNGSERVALYLAAGGKCTTCGSALTVGWHADHVTPYVRGGATDVVNGQALCPACNLRKGSRISMTYQDEFRPRPFQQQLITTVLDRFGTDQRVTVAEASPGSGKTLAYQAVATHLMREGLIDSVAVYVPRLSLAHQCELDWRYNGEEGERGHFLLFDSQCRLEKIRHRENSPPLTPPGVQRVGFVTTYQSLGRDSRLHREWARANRGRFLLVADEAQFCGASPTKLGEPAGGTVSGELIKEVAPYAAHTLLLTGTPYRSDGGKVVLATYKKGDDDKEYIVTDAQARYSDGIMHGYLRPFDSYLINADVRTRHEGGVVVEQALSADPTVRLNQVLRKEGFWKELVDKTVQELRSVKDGIHPGLKALVACQEQEDAREVAAYIKRTNPDLRVHLAVSSDGPQAADALREFKGPNADILVTVRMAFIGYDCKAITVVGLLTNYRDEGHLKQLVGRALRMWEEVPQEHQVARIVAPDDPKMQRFIDVLKEERDRGIKERQPGPPPPPPGSGPIVEDAWVTGMRGVGHFESVDAGEMARIEAIMRKHHIPATAGQMKLALEDYADIPLISSARRPKEPAPQAKTDQEQIRPLRKEAHAGISRYVMAFYGVTTDSPSFESLVKRTTRQVNDKQGIRSVSAITTVEQARERVQIVRAMLERVSA